MCCTTLTALPHALCEVTQLLSAASVEQFTIDSCINLLKERDCSMPALEILEIITEINDTPPPNSLPFQPVHHFRLSVRSCSAIYTCLQTPLSSQTLSPWCWTTLEGHKTSMDSLLAIVDRCLELAHLSLRSCGPYQPEASASYLDAARLVPLPKLRTLTMRSSPKSISSFLAHLSLPTTVSLTLEATRVEDITMFTSVLPRDLSRVPQVATGNATHARLFLRFHQWQLRLSSFSAEDRPAQLLMIFCDQPPDQPNDVLPRAICDVAQLLGAAPIEWFTFESSIGRLTAHDWLAALQRMPHLNCLDFYTMVGVNRGRIRPLFVALCGAPEGALGDMVCPQLKKMCIRDAYIYDKVMVRLIRCLEHRTSRGARLEKLVLTDRLPGNKKPRNKHVVRLQHLLDSFEQSITDEFVSADECRRGFRREFR